MEKILTESLFSIEHEFKSNELAYLALTSKIEQPLRDRWAFSLYRKISTVLVVSREWRRTDLAILDSTGPKALIELKAMYTFDAALDKKGIGGYSQDMKNDELKAKKLASDTTEIYTVLLATHPKSIVPVKYERIIKYRAGINKAIKVFNSSGIVKEVAIEAIEKKFKGENIVANGCLKGGEAFGISTDVLFWILKAIHKGRK